MGFLGEGIGDLDEGEEIKSGQKQPLGLPFRCCGAAEERKIFLVKGIATHWCSFAKLLEGGLEPHCVVNSFAKLLLQR